MELVQKRVLQFLYEKYVQSPSNWSRPDPATVGAKDQAGLIYAMKRLDGAGLVTGDGLGYRDFAHAKITARGIEALRDAGVATFLDGDGQFRLLKALYDADRENPSRGGLSVKDVNDLAIPNGAALTCYLGAAGLAKVDHAHGMEFYHARITNNGTVRYESYERDGSQKVSTTSPTDGHQHIFGPNEEAAAEQFFREVVEVARKDVLLIDRYARPGIMRILRHVPAGVNVRILTSDRLSPPPKYVADVAVVAPVEIRVVADSVFAFHDRFVVVDGLEAYAWGHSFHDAGKDRHAISELRPINRDAVLKPVNNLWPTATKVFG